MKRKFSLFFGCIMLVAVVGVLRAAETGEIVTDTITSPSLEGNLLGDPATRDMVI